MPKEKKSHENSEPSSVPISKGIPSWWRMMK